MAEFWTYKYELPVKICRPLFFLFCWTITCGAVPLFWKLQHISVSRISQKVFELGFWYSTYYMAEVQMTKLIWRIKSDFLFFLFFVNKQIDNFRKFVTSGAIQIVIMNSSDTCSPQEQLCGRGYSALETHFLLTVVIILNQRSTYYYRPIKRIFYYHYYSNKYTGLFYSFVLSILSC